MLVAGEWGVGKTYQVRKVLKELDISRPGRDPLAPEDHAYVSLYGISSATQIDVEVVNALRPGTGWLVRALGFGGYVAGKIGGVFSAGALASDFAGPILRREIANSSHRLIVFDDLERCTIRPEILTGVINRYVEHLGFKVVLLAHDGKLQQELTATTEKLIGTSIRVLPQIDEAFTNFIQNLSNSDHQHFILKHSETIKSAFKASGINSLRILRHVIEDAVRLYNISADDLVGNNSAWTQLFEWFTGLNALARAGKLERKDLENPARFLTTRARDDAATGQLPDPTDDTIEKLLNSLGRFNSSIGVLAARMFFDGLFDREELDVVLRASGPFFVSEARPAWQSVWHRFELDTEVAMSAIEEMENQFLQRAFHETGEVLHVFALRLRLAEARILGELSMDEVKQECSGYLHDLFKTANLPIVDRPESMTIMSMTGAYGLGFSVGDDGPLYDLFVNLFDEYKQILKKHANRVAKRYADNLLSMLPERPEGGLQIEVQQTSI